MACLFKERRRHEHRSTLSLENNDKILYLWFWIQWRQKNDVMKLKLSGFSWPIVGGAVLLKVFDERKSLSMSTLRNLKYLLRYFSLAYFIISFETSTPTTSTRSFWSLGRINSTRTSPLPQPISRRVKRDPSNFSSKMWENSLIISSASRFCSGFDLLYNFASFMLH